MNQYRIETTDTHPIFRVWIEGRKTSAFIAYPAGRETVPAELYQEAERMFNQSTF